jgi:hypothetical protein
MKSNPLSKVGTKLWIGLRFVLFGLVGLWVMLLSSISFFLRVFGHERGFVSPVLSLPAAVVGAAMMLYGVGEWKRWAYLWVFLSIPISLFLSEMIPGTQSDKVLPAIIAAIVAVCSCAAVRAYYSTRV